MLNCLATFATRLAVNIDVNANAVVTSTEVDVINLIGFASGNAIIMRTAAVVPAASATF